MKRLQAPRTVSGLLLLIAPLVAWGQAASTVFERVKDSVFVVKTFDSRGAQRGLASAVLLPSGKFVTNYHAVKEGSTYKVGRDEHFVTATYIAGDSKKDVCLLDAPGLTGKPVVLGKAADLKVGQPVYAVGAPKGLELSISDGIVSQLRGASPPMIQTTAAISPGSSGGGLFDSEGRLVGLTVLYIEGGQNLNFALPVEWVEGLRPGVERATKERSSGSWLARAMDLERQQKWASLLDLCLAWTKADPKDSWAWFNLGYAYGSLRRPKEAIDAYRRALRISPDSSETWCNLGIAYGSLQRHTEAVDAYRHALRIKPEEATIWCNLGIAYGALQKHPEAIDAYSHAVRINPQYADAWFNLGVTYNIAGRRDAALDAVKSLRSLDPARADRLFNLIVPR